MLNFHHVADFPRTHHICDVIKQNESKLADIDFKIEQKKKKKQIISLFPIVFATFQLPISVEPICQFQWGLL